MHMGTHTQRARESINNHSIATQHQYSKKAKEIKRRDKPTTPCPVCRISLVPVIKWAKNLERAASFVNKERLTEASRTKHSSAWKENCFNPKKKILKAAYSRTNQQEKLSS